MTVEFTSDVYTVHENLIPVIVTVFGSLTRNTSLVLRHGEDGLTLNQSISRTSGTQHVQIPASDRLNCTTPVIQITVTTNDPLVELKGNQAISIYIGTKHDIVHYQQIKI